MCCRAAQDEGSPGGSADTGGGSRAVLQQGWDAQHLPAHTLVVRCQFTARKEMPTNRKVRCNTPSGPDDVTTARAAPRGELPAAAVSAVVQTEAQLRKLPPPPASEPSFELFSRLRDLARAVAQAVEGSDSADSFRAADRSYTTFRQTVLTARPSVRLFGGKGASAGSGSNRSSSSHAWKEEDPQFGWRVLHRMRTRMGGIPRGSSHWSRHVSWQHGTGLVSCPPLCLTVCWRSSCRASRAAGTPLLLTACMLSVRSCSN